MAAMLGSSVVLRLVGFEAVGFFRTTREHNVMSLRMLVVAMGQGADKGPFVRDFCQFRQVFADLDARCFRGYWVELAPVLNGCIGLHVEGFVLG